jgi:hypothetical protein
MSKAMEAMKDELERRLGTSMTVKRDGGFLTLEPVREAAPLLDLWTVCAQCKDPAKRSEAQRRDAWASVLCDECQY